MSFDVKSIQAHLAEYKMSRLGVVEDGEWQGKQYGHILPPNEYLRNLIDAGYFPELQVAVGDVGQRLHKGFHHLNSSQALAFNLFVPLIREDWLSKLLNLIGVSDGVSETSFEYVKNQTEGTNFDFYMKGDLRAYCFEVKYTESTFGNASDDDSHVAKYDQVYKPLIEASCDVDQKEFFRDYQLWRNICYSVDNTVVFVIPKFRNDLARKIDNARKKAYHTENIHILYIDEVVSAYAEGGNERLREHYAEFAKKYLCISGTV